jgi:hypothetical protein
VALCFSNRGYRLLNALPYLSNAGDHVIAALQGAGCRFGGA